MDENEIIKLMEEGQTIDYAPLTGDLILVDHNTKTHRGVDVSLFLDIRNRGIIKKTQSMRQGHPILHSIVDIYQLVGRR